MAKYWSIADLRMEINELPNIDMINGAEKDFDSYSLDEELIAERLKESQKLIQAAQEAGFSKEEVQANPINTFADIYYGGDDLVIACSDIMDLAPEGDDCWTPAEEAFIKLSVPVLTKLYKDLYEFAKSKNTDITDFYSTDDYFSIEFEIDDSDEDMLYNYIDELVNKYSSMLGGEVFYTFHEKYTGITLFQLKLHDDFIEDILLR